MFFAISAFFELLCVLLYAFIFPKVPIVKYYRLKAASEGSTTVTADLAAAGIQKQRHQGVCIFLRVSQLFETFNLQTGFLRNKKYVSTLK